MVTDMQIYMYLIHSKVYDNKNLWGYVLQDHDGNRYIYNKTDTFRLAGKGLIYGVKLDRYLMCITSISDIDLRSLRRIQLNDLLKSDKNPYIEDKSLKNIKSISPNAFASCTSVDSVELNREISNIKPEIFSEIHSENKIKGNPIKPNKRVLK